MRRLLLPLAFVASAVSAQAQAPATPTEPNAVPRAPEPVPLVERRLSNGLRVVVEPTRSPLSALCMSYEVGHADDPNGLRGLAHLTEHLMFQPTREVPEGYLPFYERLGATYVQGVTSADSTVYCATVPEEALELALFAEAERMGFLLERLDEETVRRELRILAHEHRERTRRDLSLAADLAISASLWGRHPYRHRSEDLDALDLDAVRALHRRAYGPAHATLAIVTARPIEETLAAVARQFETLRGEPARPVTRREAPRRSSPERIEVGVRTRRNELELTWITPPWLTREDAALDVAAGVLQTRLREQWPRATARVASLHQTSMFRVKVVGDVRTDLMRLETLVGRVVLELPQMDDATCEHERDRWAQQTRSEGNRAHQLATANPASREGEALGTDALTRRYADLDCDFVRETAARWLTASSRHAAHVHFDPDAPWEGRVLPRRGFHAR